MPRLQDPTRNSASHESGASAAPSRRNHAGAIASRNTAIRFRAAAEDETLNPVDASGSEYAQQLMQDCGLTTQCVVMQPAFVPALDWAASGAMSLTGEVDGPCRFARGPLATAARAAGRVLATLAPDTPLERLDAPALLGERAALSGLSRRGTVSAGGSARLLPTRDGTIVINLPRTEDWSLVPAWMGAESAPSSPNQWASLAAHITRGTSRDLVARGRLMGLAVAEAPLQIDSPQRGFRLTHETRCVPRSAHRSGNRSGSKRLRMLDLSNLWAGPLAASLLAMAGIEVLKIESPTRPDGARHGPIEFFDLMNANKAGCALDLNEAKDRAAFERLLEAADIVLESARPRALEQLGYDAATWVGDSPGRLWVSITGYGRHGPARDWIAYGDDAAVAAGLAWPPSSPPDRPAAAQSPCFCADAIADPLSGLHAAAVVLAHRRAQRGGLLDLSLVDISARAAQFEAGPLECRIERDREDAFAVSNGRRIRIAAPRARASMGVAPELRPPDEALLSRWTSNC